MTKKRVPLSWRPKPPKPVPFDEPRLDQFVEIVFEDCDPEEIHYIIEVPEKLETLPKVTHNAVALRGLPLVLASLENQHKFRQEELSPVYQSLVNLSQGSMAAKNLCLNFNTINFATEAFSTAKSNHLIKMSILMFIRNLTTIPTGQNMACHSEQLINLLSSLLNTDATPSQDMLYQVLCILTNISCCWIGKEIVQTRHLSVLLEMFMSEKWVEQPQIISNILACIGNTSLLGTAVRELTRKENFVNKLIEISQSVESPELSLDPSVIASATFVLCRLVDPSEDMLLHSPPPKSALTAVEAAASNRLHPGSEDAVQTMKNLKIVENERKS